MRPERVHSGHAERVMFFFLSFLGEQPNTARSYELLFRS